MKLFGTAFFRSDNEDIEAAYTNGVLAMQAGEYNQADRHLRQAAKGGHVSALFNLGLLHGACDVSPMDPDFAIDCLYKAADAGHPKAKELRLGFLEPADRGSYGTVNLVHNASQMDPESGLNYMVMLNACRLIEVLCRQYSATDQVIAYELDGASYSDYPMVHRYIERTGVPADFYRNGLDSLESGCPADEITDVLNQFSIALKGAGFAEKTVIYARCTIVGHLIRSSRHGSRSKPLLGKEEFIG
ncbi:hypothetical protein GRI55_05435 [Erythrobacter citreus]|uniref:TPR repeat protein n=1 Tax=Qipengyuania citrea TaxID=225971 RepID=A0A6I4U8H8_9SPHN|nr:sel1 repeat family protein [Qipengyuania citrea]MDQ0566866.1 TPR repeat protein [Qipengyuania citrea]MXP35212.1 hypothetical protein [Qipengyuania citrea]